MKVVVALLVGIVLFLYPILVYVGLTRFQPRYIAMMLIVLFLVRIVMIREYRRPGMRPLLVILFAVVVTGGIVMISNAYLPLLVNPAIINCCAFLVFGYSLLRPPTIVEQFAQADFPILPPNCVTYCRRVTSVWCIFFFVNAAVSLHSALFWPKHYWALYNGLISYILVGLIFVVEYICRRAMIPHFQAALAAMNAVDEE